MIARGYARTNAPPRVRAYRGHTITNCGLSWYVDRPAGTAGGIWARTLANAKAKIRAMEVKS